MFIKAVSKYNYCTLQEYVVERDFVHWKSLKIFIYIKKKGFCSVFELLSPVQGLTTAKTQSWMLEEHKAEQMNATHSILIWTIIWDNSDKSLDQSGFSLRRCSSASGQGEGIVGAVGSSHLSEGEPSHPKDDLR